MKILSEATIRKLRKLLLLMAAFKVWKYASYVHFNAKETETSGGTWKCTFLHEEKIPKQPKRGPICSKKSLLFQSLFTGATEVLTCSPFVVMTINSSGPLMSDLFYVEALISHSTSLTWLSLSATLIQRETVVAQWPFQDTFDRYCHVESFYQRWQSNFLVKFWLNSTKVLIKYDYLQYSTESNVSESWE